MDRLNIIFELIDKLCDLITLFKFGCFIYNLIHKNKVE